MITALCRLGEKRRAAVRQLEEKCMAYDGTKHRMYLDSDCNLYPRMKCFFIWETASADIQSVLSVTNMEPGIAEIAAFTDPDCRGRGYFTELLHSAEEELARYGIGRAYLLHEPESADGRKVVKAIKARFAKSEYMMRKDLKAGFMAGIPVSEAGEEDLPSLARLLSEGFPMSREEALVRAAGFLGSSRALQSSGEGGLRIWKAEKEGRVAGMCACCLDGVRASLFDVCVAESERRSGIGTDMLNGVFRVLKNSGVESAVLQVGSRNKSAVGLYEKLGFVVADRIDYYKISLASGQPECYYNS